jgi:hypothetical protein
MPGYPTPKNFDFKALQNHENWSLKIYVSELFCHRLKISMQNTDSYTTRHKLQLKLFDLEKVHFHLALIRYRGYFEKYEKIPVCRNRFEIPFNDK